MDDICINIYNYVYIYMEIYGDIWRYNDICNYITISYIYISITSKNEEIVGYTYIHI